MVACQSPRKPGTPWLESQGRVKREHNAFHEIDTVYINGYLLSIRRSLLLTTSIFSPRTAESSLNSLRNQP
jgi:hypothetical protein